MRHGLHFNLGGISSQDMGIIKVNTSSGLIEEQIIASKSIIEEKIEGRERPYFYGVDYDTLSFPLPIYFEEGMDTLRIREILRWLNQDYYRPFYMEDNPERIWYVMVVNDINVLHNGVQSGFIELQLRTDSTTTLTPLIKSEFYQFRNNAQGQIITFNNEGDFDCKPIVHITMWGAGDISIANATNDTGEFKFTGLSSAEKLVVDCESKIIETNGNIPRYDNFSQKYLTFSRGENQLMVKGDFDLQFETEFKIY